MRADEVAHFPTGIRVHFEFPLYAVGRRTHVRRRLEAPIREASLSHVQRQVARQIAEMKSGQRIGRFYL